MQEFQYDVFISYSHKDLAWVKQVLFPWLERARISYHYDGDFEPGVPSIINIENGIEKSSKVILVLTPNWVGSDWTGFEEALVHTTDPIGNRRRIVPVMLETCQLPSRLSLLSYIDLRVNHLADFEAQMHRLIGSIRKQPPSPPPPKSTLQDGELDVQFPSLPVARPDWTGGLQLQLKDDLYQIISNKEEPIERYEDKGNIIWQACAMQLNKQGRPAWLKQVVKQHESRSARENFQAVRTEYALLDRLALSSYPQSIDLYEQDDALTLAYKYPPDERTYSKPDRTLAQRYRLSVQPLDFHYIRPFLNSLFPLCDTLEKLHNLGSERRAHRMLSPTSIIILTRRRRPDVAVLRDLGLAAFPVDIKKQEGPEGYQAPEQSDWGGKVRLNIPGPKTDVYQLAAIIYRVLTGLPIHSPWDILPPRIANEQISVALDEVLVRALNPDEPRLRPSMKNFSYELKRSMNQMQ